MSDVGEIHFAYDRTSGAVHIKLRPALALPSGAVTHQMHVFELLEIAARIQLQLIEDNKAMALAVASGGAVIRIAKA